MRNDMITDEVAGWIRPCRLLRCEALAHGRCIVLQLRVRTLIELVDLREWGDLEAGLDPRLGGAIHHCAVLLARGKLLRVVIVKVESRRFPVIISDPVPDRPDKGTRLQLIELKDAVLECLLYVYLADRGSAICGADALRCSLIGDLAINKLEIADLLKRLVLFHVDYHTSADLVCVLHVG